MTRERRAIDTTTASISSLSLALISVVETRRTRDRPPILIFRDVVRRSVNWLKCTEIRKPQDVGEKKGAILSTWLETCEFLAKVEQTLRVSARYPRSTFSSALLFIRQPRGSFVRLPASLDGAKLVSPSTRRENLLGRCTCNAR